jgi:hypothetical protein
MDIAGVKPRQYSIGAVRGDDGIWIYELVGSFITFNNGQITSVLTVVRALLW